MSGRFSHSAWVSVVIGILVLASGCTTGGTNTPATGGSSGSSTLQKVISSKTLRVGTITGDPPFADIGSNGQLQGYDIDLANLLAKDLGVTAVFTKTDIPGRVTAVQTGKVDVVFADFTMTLTRAQVIAFTDPYVLISIQMLAKTQNHYSSWDDLNNSNIKIGVPRGAPQATLLPQVFPKAQIIDFAGVGDVSSALASGQIQAASNNSPDNGQIIKSHPGQYEVVGGSLQTNEDNIGLAQGDYDWWLYLNEFVRKINSDGTNFALWNKYIGGPPPPFIAQVPVIGG